MTQDTKTALLVSAEKSARRSGFDGFSYADLAADVGIRKASIHYHFPSKADLSLAMMARYQDKLQTACKEIDAAETTASGRLRSLVRVYADALQDGACLCLCVAFSVSKDSLSDQTLAQMSRFRAMMLAWIEAVFGLGQSDGTIREVANPQAEAASVLALLEGAQLAARAAGKRTAFDDATQILLARAD